MALSKPTDVKETLYYEEEIYGFIYIITNNINGKRYIGQKKIDDKSRWKTYMGGGKALNASIRKHGIENFTRTIVATTTSEKESNRLESEYIKYLNAVKSEDYYNLVEGGVDFDVIHKFNRVPVICLDTGIVFHSISLASKYTGKSKTYIRSKYKRKYKHTIKNFYQEDMIFKKLPKNKKFDTLCCICGNVVIFDVFNGKKIKDYMCNRCLKELPTTQFKLKKHCELCGDIIVDTSFRKKYCSECVKNKCSKEEKIKILELRDILKREVNIIE